MSEPNRTGRAYGSEWPGLCGTGVARRLPGGRRRDAEHGRRGALGGGAGEQRRRRPSPGRPSWRDADGRRAARGPGHRSHSRTVRVRCAADGGLADASSCTPITGATRPALSSSAAWRTTSARRCAWSRRRRTPTVPRAPPRHRRPSSPSRRHPVNTAEPAHLGVGRRRVDAHHLDRHLGRHVDHVRVPVGALRRRRRPSGRLRLPVDPRSHELQLHARRRRHRAAAPRPGHGVERRGLGDRHREPVRCRAAVDDDRAAAQPRRAVDQRHVRRRAGSSSRASAPGRARRSSYAYQWMRCGADGGLPDGSNCTLDLGRRRRRATPSTVDDVGPADPHPHHGVEQPRRRRPSPRTRRRRSPRRPRPLPRRRRRATACCRRSSARRRVGSDAHGERRPLDRNGAAPLLVPVAALRRRRRPVDRRPAARRSPARRGRSTRWPQHDLGQRLRVQVTARNTLGTATATSNATALVQAAGSTPAPSPTTPDRDTPARVRSGFPNGKYSIPVTSVSEPERLIVGEIGVHAEPRSVAGAAARAPRPRRRHARLRRARCARLRALDAARHLLSPASSARGRDGWARLRMTPQADFPLASGQNVQFLAPRPQAVGRAARRASRTGGSCRSRPRAEKPSGRRFGPASAGPKRQRRQPWIEAMSGMIRIATMLAILIIGLIAGPAVSL